MVNIIKEIIQSVKIVNNKFIFLYKESGIKKKEKII